MSLTYRQSPANRSRTSQGGFSLIEVLISMLILLVGLLGVAQLHFTSFQDNRNALYRSQAAVIAEDLIDRARGNPTGFADGGYDVNYPAQSPPAEQSCVADAGCDALVIASRDRREWARNFVTTLDDYIPSLPDGTGRSVRNNAPGGVCVGNDLFTVTVTWLQPNGDRGSVEMSACL